MIIALLQCNVQTGDLRRNREKLLSFARDAGKLNVDLCVAPLQALCGPEPGCYMEQPDFRDACLESLSFLADNLPANAALLCGLPLFPGNSILIVSGNWQLVPPDFFFRNWHLLLDNGDFREEGQNYDCVIRQQAVPYAPERQEREEEYCQKLAGRLSTPVLQVNLTGGYGAYVYPGASFAVNSSGFMAARAPAFQEACLYFNDACPYTDSLESFPDMDEAQWQALCTGLGDYVHKSGASKALLGLSGGMDSALVACLAAEALGAQNVIPVMMPSPFSSASSIEDSRKLCANLGLKVLLLPIDKIFTTCQQSLAPILAEFPEKDGDLTSENLQPRIRSLLLMAIANRTGALLLNTGNKSEACMGYSTLYGDTAGAISILGDLYKSRVYELARWHNKKVGWDKIPQAILDKAPSAELRPNQKDTDSLPPYERLDPLLERISLNSGTVPENPPEFYEIRNRFFINQFKRSQSPAALQVGGSKILSCPLVGDYNP